MKELRWDLLKSERLKRTRGVSFEEILRSKLIAVKQHPQRGHQRLMLFEYRGYIWVVPCVETGGELFLKTLFPSRKYVKMHKRGDLT